MITINVFFQESVGTVAVAPSKPVNSGVHEYVSLLAQRPFINMDIAVKVSIFSHSLFICLSVRTCWVHLMQFKGQSGRFGL